MLCRDLYDGVVDEFQPALGVERPPGRFAYSLRPRKKTMTQRLLGTIDLIAGALVTLAAVALLGSGTYGFGAIALAGGIVTLWAGIVMTWSAVYVSHSRISTTRNLPHRAKREQIESIDTCRSDFGKIKQVLPIVRLKNGKSFKLLPLCLSSGQRIAPQFQEEREHMLNRQREIVEEIRSLLAVGGQDYEGE